MAFMGVLEGAKDPSQGLTGKDDIVSDIVNNLVGSQSNSQRSFVPSEGNKEKPVKEEKGDEPVMEGEKLMEAMKKVCKQDPKETLVLHDPKQQKEEEQIPCSDLNSGKKKSRFFAQVNPFGYPWVLGSLGTTVTSMSWPTVTNVVQPVVPGAVGVGLGQIVAALRTKVMEKTKAKEEKGDGPVMEGEKLMEAMKK